MRSSDRQSLLQCFLADEDGTTAVEYAVIIALIVIAIMTSVGLMATETRQSFDDTSNAINGAFN